MDRKKKRHGLPPYEGPQLQRFEFYRNKIEFIDLLDQAHKYSDKSNGRVFKVKIRGKLFAMKIVRTLHYLGWYM